MGEGWGEGGARKRGFAGETPALPADHQQLTPSH